MPPTVCPPTTSVRAVSKSAPQMPSNRSSEGAKPSKKSRIKTQRVSTSMAPMRGFSRTTSARPLNGVRGMRRIAGITLSTGGYTKEILNIAYSRIKASIRAANAKMKNSQA